MNYRNWLFSIVCLVGLSTLFTSCGNRNNSSNTAEDEIVQSDNLQTDQDDGAYTYDLDPRIGPAAPDDNNGKAVKTTYSEQHKSATQKRLNLKASSRDLSMNRPPMYGFDCLTEDRPLECSSDNVAAYIRDNLEYPDGALASGETDLETVTFTVTKEGKITDIRVDTKENPCIDCALAARAVVAALPGKWLPALENGKPVSTTVTLPIRFETIN